MINDVSRRNFVALAGAGVALGACGSTEQTKNIEKSGLTTFGPGFNHGQLAAATKPIKIADGTEFKSNYFSVLYLRFGRNGNDRKFLAFHGYGRVGADFAATQSLAEIELLDAKRTPPGSWKRSNQSANMLRREEDLDNYNFNEPNLMFVMVDHDESDIRFDDRPLKDSTPPIRANLVRFSPFLGQKDSSEIDYQNLAADNHAFFNARLVPTLSNQLKNRKLLVIDNWYLKEDGTRIPDNAGLIYSLNIHLLIANAKDKWTPIVIDPDTGNGMGNSP